jgi:CRISPR type III-A-associated protein Csm2
MNEQRRNRTQQQDRKPQTDRPPDRTQQQDRKPQAEQSPVRQETVMDKFKRLLKEERGFDNQEILKLSDELGRVLSRTTKSDTTTQIRRFYNLVRLAKEQSAVWGEAKVKIKLRTLQAQIAYAAGRETISGEFKTLIDESLRRILERPKRTVEAELQEFATFFESLLAYFYYHDKTRPGTDQQARQHKGGTRR